MLKDDEKKKREEEAKNIISNMTDVGNFINGVNSKMYNIQTNSDEEKQYLSRMQEANDIINSINPREDVPAPTVTEEDRKKSIQNAQDFIDLIDRNTNTDQLNNNIQESTQLYTNQENISTKRQNGTKSKQEIDQQVANANMKTVKTESDNPTSLVDKDISMRLANNKETQNAKELTMSNFQAQKEANKKNENIKKGGINAFNEWANTVLNNIFGGAKQSAAGYANVATTLAGFGVKGLAGASKILGLNKQADSLDTAYDNIIKTGKEINETANYERNINSQVDNGFVKLSGDVSNVISNMLSNQAIGYVLGINGTVAQGISVGGNSAQEVLDENKDKITEATLTGIAKGYVSYLTERMFDMNILTKGAEKSSIEKRIHRLIIDGIESKFGKEIAYKTVGILGENVEELVEDNAGYLIDKLINNKDIPDFKQRLSNAKETGIITTISTFIMQLLGLGGGRFSDIEMDMETEKWINEAQKIIDQENLGIQFNPNEVKNTNNTQQFYITKFNPDGELENVVPTIGKEIQVQNNKLDVTPVIVRNSDTNSYSVIDGNSGIILDSTPYQSTLEAKNGFNEKVDSLTDLQVKDINNKINKANYTLNNEIINMVRQAQEELNTTQNPQEQISDNFNTTETNYTTQNQKTNIEQNNNKPDIEKNNISDLAQDKNSSTFYSNETNYAVPDINKLKNEFGKLKTYSADELYDKWYDDIVENELDMVYNEVDPDNSTFIQLEKENGELVLKQYTGENEEVIKSEIIPSKGTGVYTSEDIQNAIEKVAALYDENRPIEGQTDLEGNIYNEQITKSSQADEEIRNIVKYNQDGKEIKDTNYVNFMTERYKDNLNISKIITDTNNISTLLDKTYQEAVKLVGTENENTLRNKQKDLMLKELYKQITDKSFTVEKTLKNQTGKLETRKLDIIITQKGLNESFNKSISDEKYAIVPDLDTIIKTSKDGIIRDESKIRSNIDEWYYLYNTANINEKLYSIKVDIKKTPQGDRFYVHRVNLIHKEGTSSQIPAVRNGTIKTSKAPSITNSISQKTKSVKNNENTINSKSIQKKENNTNIQDFGEKIGGARKDLATTRTTKHGKEIIHDYTVSNSDNGYSVNFKGKILKEGFKTQSEAEQYILDFKNNIKDNRAFIQEGTNRDGETKYMIYLRNPRTLKSQNIGKIFANKQDAENYAMALSMYLKENGKNLFRPQIQKVERVNANNKNATKATGNDILNNFGFKGGEFGNWVTQNERQQFLNYAQDAFTDLATALDITPDSLGQQGAMSIAFGARGQGLTGAVAHFEPGAKVINMTRLKGAGSLAHEYGHSIDNYLSRIGGYNEAGMATENLRNPKLSDNMKNAIKEVTDSMKYNISTNQEEINKKNAIYEKGRKESLETHLSYLDNVFNGNQTTYKYNRKTKQREQTKIQVTDKQKQQYQDIRKILLNGELDSKRTFIGNSLSSNNYEYGKTIEDLKTLYKEVVGRKINDDTVYWLYRYGQPIQQVSQIKSESAFSKSARELDKETGRATAYYSRIDEMWARAFESYISDKLKAKGIKDTYLVHSVNNNEYALFNPFPAGEERKSINKAFDNLIQTMKDEGLFTSSGTPQNIDEDTGIRYMKKNKSNKINESKQLLEKQFKDITGESIIKASAKLAGIELRNIQRRNGNLNGDIETSPYSKEAMAIYNKYNNNKESSKYLYHSTAAKNLQSIIENGLTIGNKQNQEGISSKNKLYLAATEELAQSFVPNDSITLRINPNFKLENLENDLLGGEGTYSITNNIPATMLQIKENGKWVNLLKNTETSSNDEIRLSKNTNNEKDSLRNAERQGAYIEEEIQKIEETGKWDNSIPVTKMSDIRKTIEDYLGLGIKKGRFREDAYALYKGNRDIIRTKEFKDMDSILHETGHAMDLGNRLKIDKESIANELLTAIDKLGGYEEESRTIRLEEGFAEVIREYSIIPNQAKIDYPQTVTVLEKIRQNDKNFDKFISKVQQQTYNYIHQNPRNRTLSNISIGEQTDRTPLSKEWIKQEVMRNIYDRDYALKSAVSTLQKTGGKTVNQLKASENAYLLTRLSSGIGQKVNSMLAEGYIDANGNKLMPGLNQIGEILGNNPERFNDLRAYLVAQRDTEYKAKTLKTGIRSMDSQAVIEQFKNDRQIQDASKLVYDTLNGVMQYAVDNGLINQEAADSLKQSNAFYVPMQRVLENKGNQVGRRGAVSEIIKQRTGSELDIKDVLENIISNSSNIIQQVENNNVLKALYNQGEKIEMTGKIYDIIDTPMNKIGTAKLETWKNELSKQGVDVSKLDLEKTIDLFAPSNKIDTQNLITSFINSNGKRIYLQFNDEILFNSLMNIDKKFMSQVLKINSKLNLPLKYGATMANLGFAIPNMISDTAQAAIYSTAGFIPIVDNALGVLDILTSTNNSVRKFVNSVAPNYANKINNLYNIYEQTGATSSTRLSQYRESTQNIMKDVYGTKKSENLGVQEKFKPLKRLLDLLTYIPELSEQSTRFEVFKKNYEYYKRKGNSETDTRILAAIESRDATQDFGRTGNLTREINQLIPFSAARVGSAYTFAEKITANPKQVSMRIAMLTVLALAIKSMGYDDDEIEELNQRKKDDNFVLKVGDSIVTIKKPQGILRSMINLAEYIQDLATGHIEEGKEGKRLASWIKNSLADNLPADEWGGYVPNSVAPILENWANRDFYYNTDIVKSYDLDLPNSEQYYDYNSQLAIWLGKIFNYSPAKIDNLISGYFAGLGTQITNIMDYQLGKLGVIAEKPKMGAESNTIGKRFIVNVNSNSSSIDEIYNRKTELTKLKNGGIITEEETEELETITDALSNISKLNKQIKEIKQSLSISGKEKAEKIKVLQQEKTDTARQVLGKQLIYSENENKIQSTQFYPNDTLKKNGYSLTLNSEQKKEYEQIASEYYNKYESQGLYSKEKLEQIKSNAKDYAKSELFKKYKSDLIKSK